MRSFARKGSDGPEGAAGRGDGDAVARDADAMIAEARKALWVMVGFLAVIWGVQLVNWAVGYRLSLEFGIRSRDVASLPDIVSAPFLHFSWSHIEGNSGPLFVFGFLAAYRGVRKFLAVTALIVAFAGLGAWIVSGPNTVGAGASGVVFGYFGYVIVRGFFDRHRIDIVIGLVMALSFAYQFSVIVPKEGIGWQAHLFGFIGGVVGGWVFREGKGGRRSDKATRALPETPSGSTAALLKELDDFGH
ncbi:rhomboid family intramembrane serine protease [Actinomadura alba]|uniref:Rhomboid family intramembrane serine protease n=1 Tax=Actinomadura alba TaxID=406431 RepID=A0ABR7LSY6_9ACTN|nr:rhomboid family intramembrane serine protease [Actinomadura alba]MBC6467699.1 rhomboid family intramembrane serine protease [Actinomadura alba]